MANKKISELTPKGSALSATDLLEVSVDAGGGTYTTASITGQEIKDFAGGGGGGGIHCLMPPFSGKSYMPMITFGSLTPSAITANLIRLIPFIPARDITISSTSLNVTSSGAGVNARILVYDDLNGLPNNKVIESTDLSCATTGVKTFTTTYTFLAGNTYWVGNYCSGGFSLQLIPIANLLMINNTTAGVTYTGVTYSYAFGSAPASLNGISATYSNGAFPTTMFNI
jgi:hypothetical protein